MLDLSDIAWTALENRTGDPSIIRNQLAALYANPNDIDAIKRITSSVCTTTQTYNAAYAIAPHFLSLRRNAAWEAKFLLFIAVGKFPLFDQAKYKSGRLVLPESPQIADEYNAALDEVANIAGTYLVPEFSAHGTEVSAVFLGSVGQRELGLAILNLTLP
ncbi:MAG: hypothetical protein AAGG48_31930 [Planctomycetota bacterium]